MSKSTKQLRTELAAAVQEYRDRWSEVPAAHMGDMLAERAEALLAKLDSQPSRAGKPYRVTFVHTRGTIRGRINKDSHRGLDEAVAQMRTTAGFGARVVLSVRSSEGRYSDLTGSEMAANGYPEFAPGGQFAGQYGLEI